MDREKRCTDMGIKQAGKFENAPTLVYFRDSC